MQMPEDDDTELIEDYEDYEDGMVESVTIRTTTDPIYESGWKYSLHFGDTDGNVVLRYDNSHEDSKGHERHTADGVELIEFPGMDVLKRRFDREVNEWWREQG